MLKNHKLASAIADCGFYEQDLRKMSNYTPSVGANGRLLRILRRCPY
ncbi:MAG: hypothetical protein F6K17_14195 [Okeania sp. SIO3C4]|nr:hypothetical protein [Okeania sp. SIO3B3]NER03681.1 hypothetical protein [Okeania sp. SIO3C4]